jgi:hypothetical protein
MPLYKVRSLQLLALSPILLIKAQPRKVASIAHQKNLKIRQEKYLRQRVKPILKMSKTVLRAEISANKPHKIEPKVIPNLHRSRILRYRLLRLPFLLRFVLRQQIENVQSGRITDTRKPVILKMKRN